MANKSTTTNTQKITTGVNPSEASDVASKVANQPPVEAGKSRRPGVRHNQKKRKSLPGWLWVVGLVTLAWIAVGLYLLFGSGGKGQQQAIAKLNVPDVHSLAFNGGNPSVIYFGSHSGLLKSEDGGRTWKATTLKNQDAMGLGFAGDGKVMYLSGHDVFMKSEDGGQNWRSLVDRLPGSDVHALALNPAKAANLFAYVVGAGLVKSEDGGQSWQAVSNQPGNGTLALAYGNNTLWAAVAGRGVLRSPDSGATWQAASGFANGSLNANSRVTSLAYDPTGSGMLYAGTSDGLYHSMDGGTSWNRLGYTGQIAALALNPSNPDNLLIVNAEGEVFRSEDGGLSWPSK